MGGNIDHSIYNCNSPVYLTGYSTSYSLLCMSFSERVKAARTFANLTQEQLAEKAGMQQPSVWYLENGKGAESVADRSAIRASATLAPADGSRPPPVPAERPHGDAGLFLFLFALYFFPAIIGGGRGHHNAGAICVLNILLGWTVLGWIVALVWACTAIRPAGRAPPKA